MKNTVITSAVMLAFVMGGVANAKQPVRAKPKPPVEFKVMDTNSDGSISREEVRYMDDLNGAFRTLDGNADDKLTPSEYSKWKRAAHAPAGAPAPAPIAKQ